MEADPPASAPYGSWSSPISPAMIATGQVRVSETTAQHDATYWLESRPSDGGRTRVMCHRPDRGVHAVTSGDVNCRTRVHEYGGGAYAVHDTTVFFTNFEDQRLYRLAPGSAPRAITEEPPQPCSLRYADMCPTPDGRRLVCVRERHESTAVHNELVLVEADGAGPPVVLDHGHDFYSFPRVSPDGTRLAWTVWDHPNMPWDETELMVGELSPEGGLSDVRRVAGGEGESIFQPAWSPAGSLHFVSDRTGWWNLYELGPGGVRALAPMQAEAGEPQWMFGQSSYAFVPDGIAAVLREGPRQRLALLSSESAEVVDLPVPQTSFDVPYLHAAGNRLVFVAGGPALAEGVISLDRDSGLVETLRTTLTVPVAPSCISVPREIEFPTSGGATAHALFYAPRNAATSGAGDELPPAIVVSHGGPTGQASTCLDLAVQLWTSRGFAVIDVDYRGSTGYGRAYRQALRGQWGVADVEDCVNAARHLSAEVDPRRLAIRGASAGGYTTLCALAFTDDFAAGASYFGVGDLESLTRETHKFESRYLDALIGPYPEQAELYRERSPIHAVDRLRCPIILLQGLLDEVVPPDQAATMAAALQAAGIPCVHLTFPDEAHGFRRSENIERALTAELDFYAGVFGFDAASVADADLATEE
ncbi:MAG: hypothetical protein QOI64_560 [Solirubrobacteraceae bacterium]|nr:hypothetical protein [Solirubrobacteraceae bacterium]